jgi:hypothetical protein
MTRPHIPVADTVPLPEFVQIASDYPAFHVARPLRPGGNHGGRQRRVATPVTLPGFSGVLQNRSNTHLQW